MASPKRKPARSTKSARSRATRSAYKPSTARAAKNEAPATAWTQPVAQLYQLPFNAEEVNEATRRAAANATEIWRNMWDPNSQQWNQFFAGAQKFPGLDTQAGEHLKHFSKQSAGQFTRTASNATQALNEACELSRENAETCMECGNLAVSVSKELSAELINYANRTFAQNVELSKQILNCRTLNDLFDLSGRMVKANLDGFFSESVHLSEVLFRSATDISEPLNERLSETTERLTKAMAA